MKNVRNGTKNVRKGMKNVKNPHILHTILHILLPFEILQFFIFFEFFSLENITIFFLLILSKLRNDENYPKKI